MAKAAGLPHHLQVRPDRELADGLSFRPAGRPQGGDQEGDPGSRTKDKAAFDKIYEGKQLPFAEVDHKAYEPVIELVKFVDELRKKKTSS